MERNPLPHTSAILFADQIIVEASTGKKSLIGIFSTICSTALPMEREINIFVELTDAVGEYQFTLELVHLETGMLVATGSMGPVVSRDPLRPMEIIIRLPARLPRHGKYEFRMSCGKSVFASRVFSFRALSQAKETAPELDTPEGTR